MKIVNSFNFGLNIRGAIKISLLTCDVIKTNSEESLTYSHIKQAQLQQSRTKGIFMGVVMGVNNINVNPVDHHVIITNQHFVLVCMFHYITQNTFIINILVWVKRSSTEMLLS